MPSQFLGQIAGKLALVSVSMTPSWYWVNPNGPGSAVVTNNPQIAMSYNNYMVTVGWQGSSAHICLLGPRGQCSHPLKYPQAYASVTKSMRGSYTDN